MEDFQQNVPLPWLKGGVDLEPGPCSATHLAVSGQVQHPWEAIKHILTQCSPTSSRHAWKALGASSPETQTLFSCSVPPHSWSVRRSAGLKGPSLMMTSKRWKR